MKYLLIFMASLVMPLLNVWTNFCDLLFHQKTDYIEAMVIFILFVPIFGCIYEIAKNFVSEHFSEGIKEMQRRSHVAINKIIRKVKKGVLL